MQVSRPFILGSKEHKEAVSELEDYHQPDYVELAADDLRIWHAWPTVGSPLVIWCDSPVDGQFYKILDCAALDKCAGGGAWKLRALYATYERFAEVLAAAAADGDYVPGALVPAELLYGAFEVAVRMRFVGKETVRVEDVEAGGAVLDAVLDAVVPAIVWLARRGLMYVDLRAPNIVIGDDDKRYYLVDYDDMVVLPGPVTEADTLISAIRADAKGGACALDTIQPLKQRIVDCYKY